MRSLLVFALFLVAIFSPILASPKQACIAPADALKHVNKDVCVAAHVYRIVDAANGIHFIDVCSPETSDADCQFFILSLERDKQSVGDLQSLVGQTIQIRGTIHTIQGRAEIVLSSERQLHGGKKPFHPNPQLVKNFSAENGGQAFRARNGSMGQHGVHFSHMGK
jgi:hypothetical protein